MKALFFALFASAIIIACSSEEEVPMDNVEYDATEIAEDRAAKDELFRGESSPIPADARANFSGLRYYPPDESYAVLAWAEPFAKPDTVTILTTRGDDPRRALRVGTLQFTVKGRKGTLIGYQFVDGSDMNQWFIPFADATTGKETYSVGRYIEILAVDEADSVLLDFNRAYSPFCAYNSDYSCPLVPAENRLTMAIRAGEKTWK